MIQPGPSATSVACRTPTLVLYVAGSFVVVIQKLLDFKALRSWLAKERSFEHHRHIANRVFSLPLFGIHSHTLDQIEGALLLPIVFGTQNIDILPVLTSGPSRYWIEVVLSVCHGG